MTPHQILIVGIRLLVIFWFLSLLGHGGVIVATLQNMDVSATPYLMTLGVELVAVVALWLFPAALASKLLRSGNVPVQASAVAFDEWRDLVFVGVGIFVLTRAIPEVIYWAILATAPDPSSPEFTLDQKANVWMSLVELAIGLVLTLGASSISTLIQKGRRVEVASRSSAEG